MLTRASVLLRRQDGGRQQLERVLEVQRAQLGRRARVELGQPLDRPAAPAPSVSSASPPVHGTGLRWPAVDAVHMDVVELRELRDPDRAALAALLARADAADGHPALPEPQLLAVTHPVTEAPSRGGPPRARPRRGRELAGCAFVTPAQRRLRPCSTSSSTRRPRRGRSRPH